MSVRAMVTLGLLALATEARADGVCVDIDAVRDTLETVEQAAARRVFENALLVSGASLEEPCEAWLLSHVRLGDTIHVLVTTPRGSHGATADSLDDLGRAYAELVEEARRPAGPPIEHEPAVPRRRETPAVREQPIDRGIAGQLYLRVGYGVSPPMESYQTWRLGPTLGVGYRRNLERWLLDISVLNTHIWENAQGDYDVNVLSFVRIAVSRFMVDEPARAAYLGGAISFGQPAFAIENQDYYTDTQRAYALQGELVAGYEILRDKPVKLFFEAALVVPFDQMTGIAYGTNPVTGEQIEDAYETLAPWTLGGSAGVSF